MPAEICNLGELAFAEMHQDITERVLKEMPVNKKNKNDELLILVSLVRHLIARKWNKYQLHRLLRDNYEQLIDLLTEQALEVWSEMILEIRRRNPNS